MMIGASKPNKNRRITLSGLLNNRLVSYATAATAAGAGLLGLARPAEAQVVFTPVHVRIGFLGSYALDLNHDGTLDFLIRNLATANCSTVFDALLAKAVVGNAVMGGRSQFASALKAGARIGSSQGFVSHGRDGELMASVIDSPGGGQVRGQWINIANRYLGLKFQIAGQTHYGWARFTVQVSPKRIAVAALTGYAYQATPNTPILAGQEQGAAGDAGIRPASRIKGDSGPDAFAAQPPTDLPRAASLGLLALGADGIPLWRRKQPAA